MADRKAVTRFDSLAEKAMWMDASASVDALDPFVQSMARIIVAGTNDPSVWLRRIQEWTRDRIRYSGDPWGIERTPDTRVTIEQGTEDCDGKIKAFVALVRALKSPAVDARVRSVWNDRGDFFHVQGQARLHAGLWRDVEVTVRDVDIGERPTIQTSRFVV